MYAPAAPSGGSFEAEDFEFIEVQNTSATPLNVGGVKFSAGIAYTFANTTIPAGGLDHGWRLVEHNAGSLPTPVMSDEE